MQFRYVIGPDGTVASSDRGLAYGDGLFETISVRAGLPQRFDLHLDRLRTGCERLGLPQPVGGELEKRIASLVADIGRGYLKLIMTRGSGPRGYAPPESPVPTVILTAGASSDLAPRSISAVTLRQRLSENVTLAGIKHLCRLEQVLAQLELKSFDADEGLMLSASGKVIGGTSRNVFAVFGQQLVTPELSVAGIRGVMRRQVLEQCAAAGWQAEESGLLPSDLASADELFMTNALVGIQSVTRLDGKTYDSDRIATHLRETLGLEPDV